MILAFIIGSVFIGLSGYAFGKCAATEEAYDRGVHAERERIRMAAIASSRRSHPTNHKIGDR